MIQPAEEEGYGGRCLPRAWQLWAVLLLSGCGRHPRSTDADRRVEIAGHAERHAQRRRPHAGLTATLVPATPSNTPTPTVTPTPIIYTIQKGDTLLEVARAFGVTVREIQAVNGIEDARRLWIGQEILIPTRKKRAAEPTVVPTPTPVALKIVGLGLLPDTGGQPVVPGGGGEPIDRAGRGDPGPRSPSTMRRASCWPRVRRSRS